MKTRARPRCSAIATGFEDLERGRCVSTPNVSIRPQLSSGVHLERERCVSIAIAVPLRSLNQIARYLHEVKLAFLQYVRQRSKEVAVGVQYGKDVALRRCECLNKSSVVVETESMYVFYLSSLLVLVPSILALL